MSYTEPSFEIDEKGRVICQSHSSYPFFMMPGKNIYEEKNMEALLTCKKCTHYQTDSCFFPKEEISRIEIDRVERGTFKCSLCGMRIDRMLTVMQKLYFKQRFNIEMPLICCACYDSLKKNEFIKSSKKQSQYLIFGLITTVVFMVLLFSYVQFFMFLLVLPILFSVYSNAKRLVQIRKGRNYYRKYFLNDETLDKA